MLIQIHNNKKVSINWNKSGASKAAISNAANADISRIKSTLFKQIAFATFSLKQSV